MSCTTPSTRCLAAAGERAGQLNLLRAAFIPWLATINPDNDQPMRRVARYSDLPDESRPLIDALVEKRLLVRDERDGQVVVEVALESLLRQWDELAGWLREERQHLKIADDIERNTTAWHTHHHDPAWLLTGTRLADAETLANTPGFSDRLAGARDYLTASRRQRTSAWPKKKNTAKPNSATPRNANKPPKPTPPTCVSVPASCGGLAGTA